VIENTNEAVRVCGENNVAAVTISGFTCNTPTFLLKARYQIESF